MKLTTTSIGCRFRKKDWPVHRYVDINYFGKFWIRGTDQNGNLVDIEKDDKDLDWINIGETSVGSSRFP